MAEQVDTLALPRRIPVVRDKYAGYDIETWAKSGEVWQAEQSRDFPDVTARTFRAHLYRWAGEHGYKVTTSTKDNVVRFQFTNVPRTSR